MRVPLVRNLTSIGADASADVRIPSLAKRWAVIRRDADGTLSLRLVDSGKSQPLVPGAPLRVGEVQLEVREERAREATVDELDVSAVSDALSHDVGHEEGLRSLVRTTMVATAADIGALLVLEGGAPRVAVAERADHSPIDDPLALLSDTIVREAFTAAHQVRIDDASMDDRYRSLPSVVGLALRSVLCMPMTLEGRVVGVLYLGRHGGERPFSPGLTRDLGVLCAMCVPLLVAWRRTRGASPAPDSETWLEGEHASMVELRRLVGRVAQSSLAVYVRGETGAGKELVARALHAKSPRHAMPFVAVNCAAVSETLLASELFGVKKGAFTGATHDREGLIESARGGTLFLDEVGDMPQPMQAALLRVLERREVIRVGDTTPRPVDFRLVCATHRALDAEVAAGRFRADLLFRLCEMTIDLPPLRDRGDDVLLLAHRFAKLAASEIGERAPVFAPDAIRRLCEHRFPGNVRELRAVVRRAVVLADGGVVHERDLGLSGDAPVRGPSPTTTPAHEGTLEEAWRRYSGELAQRALERAGGNRELAATGLGISVRTLYRLLTSR